MADPPLSAQPSLFAQPSLITPNHEASDPTSCAGGCPAPTPRVSLARPTDPQLRGGGSVTFATIARPSSYNFLFPPISLAARQYGTKDGCPAISFSPSEVAAGKQRLQHSLVAKFSGGRPRIDEVRKVFEQAWSLAGVASIGAWDARHILVILKSEEDARRVLAHPLRRVDQYQFRLFRWSEDFHSKKEPTMITTWVRLPALPPQLYDVGVISSILSSVGRFLAVDEKTKGFTNPSFARACIELDLSKSVPGKVWISVGNNNGFWQYLEYESKLFYCSRCNLHGHQLSNCRKSKVAGDAAAKGKEGTAGVDQVDNSARIPSTSHPKVASIPITSEVHENWQVHQSRKARRHAKKAKSVLQQKVVTGHDLNRMDTSFDHPTSDGQLRVSSGQKECDMPILGEVSEAAQAIVVHDDNSRPRVNSHNPVSSEGTTMVPLLDKEFSQSQFNGTEEDDAGPRAECQNRNVESDNINMQQVDPAPSCVTPVDDVTASPPEVIDQRIASYGSLMFGYQKDDHSESEHLDARGFYMRLKASHKDDARIFQIMDKYIDLLQSHEEGSNSPFETEEDPVDLSRILKQPRQKSKGSRHSGRSCPKKKDSNFVY